MSKNKKNDFKYKPDQRLPSITIKKEWDLKKLYYPSEHSPAIEKDVKKTEQAYAAFAKAYASTDFTKSAKSLRKALDTFETLMVRPELSKPARYFWYRSVLNAKDSVAQKKLNLIEERLTNAANKLVFFELKIGKLPTSVQKKYLADPLLLKYRYYLQQVFDSAKHLLTEPEEKILSLKSRTSYGMWTQGTEKILSNKEVSYKNKKIPFPEALETIDTLPTKEKQKLWDAILDVLENVSEVAENEFNAIITDKKINDSLRGYKKPYSATIMSYENNEKSVEALVKAISSKGFALSNDFYKAKASFHGVKRLPYVNKYDPIGAEDTVSFETAVTVCRDTFYGLKVEYGQIFDRMLQHGHIDVFPKKGKRSGAFMSADVSQPTLVFLNHTSTFKALETLAHEVGHAIHAERSKGQSPIYQDFSTTTAETASTLFEQLVFQRVLAVCTDAQKRNLLHDKIQRDIATIQRQIAFYNFELELHESIREHGATTSEELQSMMQRHLQSYLGPAIEVTKRDGYAFVYVPHFRYGFYVYTYAYGLLVSSIMATKYENDPSYIREIDTFLTAGGKDTVENIFKEIGIDTSNVKTFNASLDVLASDIELFKKLLKK